MKASLSSGKDQPRIAGGNHRGGSQGGKQGRREG